MKIVIDIPEEWFCRLQNEWGWALAENVREAIKSGTRLPKGHGRLIDADALERFIDYGHLNSPDAKMYSENDIRALVDHTPTIIETDKEASE